MPHQDRIDAMSESNTSTVKKPVRRKSSVTSVSSSPPVINISASTKNFDVIISAFSDLVTRITEAKAEFENLQKEIISTKEAWIKEQKDHELKITERNQQEETARKREEETYRYETNLARKKEEDEFEQKKEKWEKELAERKEEIENDKKELELLRKQMAGFEGEKEKAVKEAVIQLQKELTGKFDTERKLREQEVHSDKELLDLQISTLTIDNTRLNSEITASKRALDEATRQVKDIAVKVIEASNTGMKNQTAEE